MAQRERFTQADIDHYEAHGYVFLENFLDEGELEAIHADAERVFPGWRYVVDPSIARPDGYEPPVDPPANPRFPFDGEALNAMTFHPELRRFAATVSGHDNFFCEQSDLTFKARGLLRDTDQHMHMDFGNHTLAYPSSDRRFWQTTFLVYYSEVTESHAPTAVVPWEHYRDEVHWPIVHSRRKRPDLYEKEVLGIVPAGSVLAYSTRTYHRGTAFTEDVGRLAHFISYAPRNCPWLGIVSWPIQAVKDSYHEWMAQSSLEERGMLGFPPPGHDYWTEEMIIRVKARFPGMDMTPYQEALAINS